MWIDQRVEIFLETNREGMSHKKEMPQEGRKKKQSHESPLERGPGERRKKTLLSLTSALKRILNFRWTSTSRAKKKGDRWGRMRARQDLASKGKSDIKP